ncbi:ParB/RepB/Spo0J family partition protein [Dissulfurirhabdus thermomarina]|uniref:ParB/RepB/Spo0J family partition protein n=1 Tax=Dissulfurirhabdus thermomarina TaxID=1765737 RepID=A0A6N9TSQ0_DISTH|nr:ParB/RepB/Spo0J family partition protein [Dissulfurirhabdus thermomarina]NDY41566.1 ParB/RepB/Spo0J family partition protein [Dissulfurirhabdus thermomarina]NMX22379.1 ParB/RepB/Spo0J family partition protein [Dissulfurirhabdus thermomarina]
MKPKKGLGKGLSALLPTTDVFDSEGPGFFQCPVEKIHPNPEQPRRQMDRAALEGLAASIREKGVIQPLVVREAGGGYELIAGERRWRAAQLAGLKTVPVVIKDISPGEVLELALIENIQREDLNPLEEAMAYQRLVEEFGLTQAQVAQRVGKERSTVANSLRLLRLPAPIREDLAEGRLTMGHARALLTLEDDAARLALRDEILAKGLSVRETEARARRPAAGARRAAAPRRDDPDLRRLADELTRLLGHRVRVVHRGDGGRIEIHYRSLDEFDRILHRLRDTGPR